METDKCEYYFLITLRTKFELVQSVLHDRQVHRNQQSGNQQARQVCVFSFPSCLLIMYTCSLGNAALHYLAMGEHFESDVIMQAMKCKVIQCDLPNHVLFFVCQLYPFTNKTLILGWNYSASLLVPEISNRGLC
jgi:hypothetical protein